jgi:hypothetical protein
MPRTPLIGVRISWLTLARNSDLAAEARTASSRAVASASAYRARVRCARRRLRLVWIWKPSPARIRAASRAAMNRTRLRRCVAEASAWSAGTSAVTVQPMPGIGSEAESTGPSVPRQLVKTLRPASAASTRASSRREVSANSRPAGSATRTPARSVISSRIP